MIRAPLVQVTADDASAIRIAMKALDSYEFGDAWCVLDGLATRIEDATAGSVTQLRKELATAKRTIAALRADRDRTPQPPKPPRVVRRFIDSRITVPLPDTQ